MKSDTGTVKIYCKYFEKALCLRDDVTKCQVCPYYKIVGSSKNGESENR